MTGVYKVGSKIQLSVYIKKFITVKDTWPLILPKVWLLLSDVLIPSFSHFPEQFWKGFSVSVTSQAVRAAWASWTASTCFRIIAILALGKKAHGEQAGEQRKENTQHCSWTCVSAGCHIWAAFSIFFIYHFLELLRKMARMNGFQVNGRILRGIQGSVRFIVILLKHSLYIFVRAWFFGWCLIICIHCFLDMLCAFSRRQEVPEDNICVLTRTNICN